MKRNTILVCAALALAVLAAAYLYVPRSFRPVFGEGEVLVCFNEDGSFDIEWPEAKASVPEDVREKLKSALQRGALADAAAGIAEEDGCTYEEALDRIVDDVSYIQSMRRSGEAMPVEYPVFSNGGRAWTVSLPVTLQLRAESWGMDLLGLPRRASSEKRTAQIEAVDLGAPEAKAVPAPGELSLEWTLAGRAPDFYEVFTIDEEGRAHRAAAADAKSLTLTVGREGDIPMPAYGHPLQIQVRAAVRGEGCILCGPASDLVRVERQDLLGDELDLIYRETAPRVVSLEWEEIRGEYYELQEWDGEDWVLLDTLEPAERSVYELGRLGSGSYHRYRVAAKDRGGVRSSEEVEFYASADPLYATVWPIIGQPYYEGPDAGSASLGKIPGGTALCVLEEQGDWFRVRYKDRYGYIDSRFCMIDLPGYVGDHCEYDITNSYSSVFKVHESPIALITDQVVTGFEHVQEEDGGFLVPYLYPCAKKLLTAARRAEEDGYRLKIYEAFRPNEATRYLYDTTSAQLDWAALVYSFEDEEGVPLGEDEEPRVLDPVTGWAVDLADGLLLDPETGEKISREDLALRQEGGAEGAEDGDAPPPEGGVPAPDAPAGPEAPSFALLEEETGLQLSGGGSQAAPPSETDAPPQEDGQADDGTEDGEGEAETEYDTYFKIMTDGGRFRLSSFLAQVASAHNRGIALDLTLEAIDSGEELEMQSAIHDLSWYSAAYLNNDNAKRLERYMTGVGMRGLSSEWWHFQDDETREAIGLSSYLSKGVDMSGWTRDDRGWRYRDADGSIFKDTTITVDGKRWTLDRDGYAAD
nr:M15 family metallopeptidase [uncultured Oscillibacter sp.]